jgi:hypothetical protein
MEIITGKQQEPQRVVAFGQEGVGKSQFASMFPSPVFIDTEGSTGRLDVARTPKPSSWSHLMSFIADLRRDPKGFKTLVVDTADWAQRLCVAQLCSAQGKDGIEGFGYGKGFTYLAEEFGKFLDALTDLSNAHGMHVVLTAHAATRKFELPEEEGAYDKWEMKLEKKVAALVKEWATMVLFVRYKTLVITDDKTHKSKAHGARRVMHTQASATWDAKNRDGLAPELPFEIENGVHQGWESIKHLFVSVAPVSKKTAPVDTPAPAPAATEPAPIARMSVLQLKDMIRESGLTERQIQEAVGKRGFYPADTPIENYDDKFITGCLIPQWDRVLNAIKGAA